MGGPGSGSRGARLGHYEHVRATLKRDDLERLRAYVKQQTSDEAAARKLGVGIATLWKLLDGMGCEVRSRDAVAAKLAAMRAA